MSRRDIELALALVAERLPHLRQPRRLRPEAFAAGDRCLGQYHLPSDTLRLNARYLADLDEATAHDLLDTILHELLHKRSSWLRQLRDTWLPHPHIDAQAAHLAGALAEAFAWRRSCQQKATQPEEFAVFRGEGLDIAG